MAEGNPIFWDITLSITFTVKQSEKNDPEDEGAMILQNSWNFLCSDTA
jgi:hypothetical protein